MPTSSTCVPLYEKGNAALNGLPTISTAEVVIAEEQEKQRRGRISSSRQWIGPATWSASISWIHEGRLFQTRLREELKTIP
ncbi:hypothetical protein SUGI_1008860 [Cryptomeria japonica]|nr:hypothetical protein SUGI_1008860 [Cryptomeria japonica]